MSKPRQAWDVGTVPPTCSFCCYIMRWWPDVAHRYQLIKTHVTLANKLLCIIAFNHWLIKRTLPCHCEWNRWFTMIGIQCPLCTNLSISHLISLDVVSKTHFQNIEKPSCDNLTNQWARRFSNFMYMIISTYHIYHILLHCIST